MDINIGMIIAINRQQQGITQEELSKGICSVPYLSKLENNKIVANEEIVTLLLSRLGLSYENVVSEQKQLNEEILAWYQTIINRDSNKADQYAHKLPKKMEHIQNINLVLNYKLALLRYHLYKKQLSPALELIEFFDKIKGKLTTSQLLYFHCFQGIYLCLNNHYEEGIQQFEIAKKLSDKIRYTEPELIYYLALTYSYLYRPSLALVYGHQALDLFNSASQYLRSIDCQLMIGINYIRIKQFNQAEQHFQNILNIAQSLKLENIIAKVYHNLGYLYSFKGDSQKAINYYLKALRYKKENIEYLKTAYFLAKEYVLAGDISSANSLISECLEKFKTIQEAEDFILKLHMLNHEINSVQETLRTFIEETVIPYFHSKKDWPFLIECYEKLANIYSKNFYYKKSSYYYQLAIEQRKKFMI
jgi:tetratricopeptide (TPR) repeat protein